jgi:hypothetical protein
MSDSSKISRTVSLICILSLGSMFSFLEEQKAKQEDDEEETGKQEQEYDDEGNLVICRVSAKP